MGLSASSQKRVSQDLRASSDFNSVCDSVYNDCLALTQHAFPGVKPYQLASASDRIHASLTRIHYPLVQKWLPSPPTRSQVDNAFRSVTADDGDEVALGEDEFKRFGVELYSNAVASSAGKTVMVRVPATVAGIVGIGVVTRSGQDLVRAAVGSYALGAAASFYFGF